MIKNSFFAIEQILFRPVVFFENLRQKKSPTVNVFLFFWMITPVVAAIIAYQTYALSSGRMSEVTTVVFFLAKIFQAALNIAMMSGVFHLLLKLLKGMGKYFDTLSVCIYAYTGTHVFNTIYGVGPFIRIFWMMVALIVGFKILHEISYKKASWLVIILLAVGFIVTLIQKEELEQKWQKSRTSLRDTQHTLDFSRNIYHYNQTFKKV